MMRGFSLLVVSGQLALSVVSGQLSVVCNLRSEILDLRSHLLTFPTGAGLLPPK
jgi:hypothetical protein